MKVSFEVDSKQIDKLYNDLGKIYGNIGTKEFRDEILEKPAKLVRDVARSNISDAVRPINRYAKLNGGKKVGKGKGTILATYERGNLRKSISVLKFRRAVDTITIGARYGKKKKYDGWYAFHVEFGSGGNVGKSFGYMRRAWLSTETRVKSMIIKKLQFWLKKENSKTSG